MPDISLSLRGSSREGRDLPVAKLGFMATFTPISLRMRLILSEVSRIEGKQVNDVNGAFLEDTNFLAKLREQLRGNLLSNKVF